MTLEVIKGHIRSSIYLEINSFFDICFVCNLILSKFGMNVNIIKKQIFHYMKFDIKGHFLIL